MKLDRRTSALIVLGVALVCLGWPNGLSAQRPQKPVLHGKHWVAITGKPMAATAGSMM